MKVWAGAGSALVRSLAVTATLTWWPVQAAVHVVAPGQNLAVVLARAADGDEVQLQAGVHRAQVGVILQRRLTLRGVGGRAVLQADGAHAEGKAILVVREYAGAIARFTVSGSHLSQGRHAHLVKSRARENHVLNNQLVDGEGGSAAYELDFPNGGVVDVMGNTIEQSAATTNLVMLAFGTEGERDNRTHRLRVENNTFINHAWLPAIFVRVHEARLKSPVTRTMLNNTFTGPGVPVR